MTIGLPVSFPGQQMLRAAIESILDDDSFKLPSTHARVALETANQLVTWLKDEHQHKFIKFSQELTSSLQTYFESQAASTKTRRERCIIAYKCLLISKPSGPLFLPSSHPRNPILPFTSMLLTYVLGNQNFLPMSAK